MNQRYKRVERNGVVVEIILFEDGVYGIRRVGGTDTQYVWRGLLRWMDWPWLWFRSDAYLIERLINKASHLPTRDTSTFDAIDGVEVSQLGQRLSSRDLRNS